MLILASASPRRKELLTQMGLSFSVDPSDCDESFADGLPPAAMVAALSKAKAEAVFARHENDIILAADTVVALGDEVLGKPADPADAVRMLLSLSGRTHRVYTGVTVLAKNFAETFVSDTAVTFAALSKAEAEAYVATGEPLDKAGAYGVQGRGSVFVEKIDGDYFTVVGLPVCKTWKTLKQAKDRGDF